MESIIAGGLTFRWADNVLLITTPTGQHMLNGRATAHVLTFLDANRDDIFAVDQANEVPDWAQPESPGRYVVGSLVSEQERQPPAAGRRHTRRRSQNRQS